eukprot:g8642.t1
MRCARSGTEGRRWCLVRTLSTPRSRGATALSNPVGPTTRLGLWPWSVETSRIPWAKKSSTRTGHGRCGRRDGATRDGDGERLFVMSRPRVFRRYHRILGLSGSIGSDPERRFLQETYRAAFFEVPPFLKTCRGSPFHEPLPAKLGSSQAPIYVEETTEAQTSRIAEVAFEARDRVPVLIIARDRVHADHLVESLQAAARSRGLGATSEDVVRSLSRTLYEAEPEQWKENLNRATMPLGQEQGRNKPGSPRDHREPHDM